MTRRHLVIGLGAGAGALVVGLVGFGAGYYVAKQQESADVRGNATQEFVETQAPVVKPPPLPGIAWPMWGFDTVHNRISPYAHRPPYRTVWSFGAKQLVEFPPVVAYGRLTFTNNPGVTFSVDTKTGKEVWSHRSGRCTASSPAVDSKLVFQAFLNRPPCNSSRSPSVLTGEVVAFDALTGKVRWRTVIGPTESSPLVHQGRVYVGDWRGLVYALDAKTGRIVWRFQTGGRVKGAVAALGNRVFVGSYDGRLSALDSRTGALQWRTSSQGRLGGRGRFYSTPAVAYGRVFIGSTDGKVYAFGARTGDLIWSRSTGGYVYSSPAVWEQARARRLLLGELLRDRCRDGRGEMAVCGGREDLGSADRDGRERLLRDARAPHVRPRCAKRPSRVVVPRRPVLAARRRCRPCVPGRDRPRLRADREALRRLV